MTREKIVDAVRAAANDGRLGCEQAHALARELNVSLQELGEVCNELKIKIAACQLGCF